MLATGERRTGDEYDVLRIVRAVCDEIPSAYVASSLTADDAVIRRLESLRESGIQLSAALTAEDVAASERRKVESWGGLVVELRARGPEPGLIAFIGPKRVAIRGDGRTVTDTSIRGIQRRLHDLGYTEIRLE